MVAHVFWANQSHFTFIVNRTRKGLAKLFLSYKQIKYPSASLFFTASYQQAQANKLTLTLKTNSFSFLFSFIDAATHGGKKTEENRQPCRVKQDKMLKHIIITTLNKAFINPISFCWARGKREHGEIGQEQREIKEFVWVAKEKLRHENYT